MDLKEKLTNIPTNPGCYLYKDKNGTIIYVGKAGVLRNRVRSYFTASRPQHPKLSALVKRIRDIEWIITDSEVEALILENNLIKEYKPRYNIDLKDDKSYPYIRITNEAFPRIFITRKVDRDGSTYFGPYTNVKNVRYALKTLKKIFPIRSCSHYLKPEIVKAKKIDLCLDYYINKCQGPCQGLQTITEYDEMINKIKYFLKGKTDNLSQELRDEMNLLSENLRYEEAARVRDKLEALESYRNAQKVVQIDYKDRDIMGMAKEDDDACVAIFKIREGKIVGRMHFYMSRVEWESEQRILQSFLNRYYDDTDDIPREIFLPVEIGETETYEAWLSEKSGSRVTVHIPLIGEKKRLMNLCVKNANYLLQDLKLQKMKKKDYMAHSVMALQRDLSLEKIPKRIECFDISNIQGTDPVASMVSFDNGKPKKSEYRKYKIQIKDTPDDFAMMREVLFRRYSRLLREKKDFPDLIVVDGGKGQLSSAVAILKNLGVENQAIIGLAKRLEEVFFPGISDAQMIPKTSSSLKLLQQVRDEAHRFAITFHRERRKKRTITSVLDKIEGIGDKRRNYLLKTFGSVKKIKETTVEDLQVKGKLPKNIAEKVYKYFH